MFTRILGRTQAMLKNRRAQVLLPAVLLAPIFVLVIYLLFEMAKVSMTKVRNQFALDNSAYSQTSSASTYLNAVAMIDAPLTYRVMKSLNARLKAKSGGSGPTVFDVFYQAGGTPAIGSPASPSEIANKNPKADALDWQVHYYGPKRAAWLKDTPGDLPAEEYYKDKSGKGDYLIVTDKDLTANAFFPAVEVALPYMRDYITTFIRTGAIYDSQTFTYKAVTKNMAMFREAYWLNTVDCNKADCARESANTLENYLSQIQTKAKKVDKLAFYVSESSGGAITGSYPVPIDMSDLIKDSLFQFGYLTPGAISRLGALKRGVLLKQKYKLPKNHFNINLTEKYTPLVRTTVSLTCPRNSNNCVWPNPLPKYNVRIAP